jgi:hypothetical protein
MDVLNDVVHNDRINRLRREACLFQGAKDNRYAMVLSGSSYGFFIRFNTLNVPTQIPHRSQKVTVPRPYIQQLTPGMSV